ncbi:MAG: NADP-dependent phosphogluconate dehydrogenase [Myxococcota bacterium]
MSEATADIGVIGLGVMGAALARNFKSRGYTVAVYNRDDDILKTFNERHGDAFTAAPSYEAFVASLKAPRKIVMMVTAGKVVDFVLNDLTPHLGAGDIVVDGGNSHFDDTDRRLKAAADAPWQFVGMGVSGGEEGALKGPSMMPGGSKAAWEQLKPYLESAAAVSDSGPCVTWCGRGSAGHFVKMVHNGIEYADMQLIAEVHDLLRRGLGKSPAQAREIFTRWNDGVLSSFLIEITAQIVGAKDPKGDGILLDAILDEAGQKGTGRWTAVSAIKDGVPVSTIVSAVDGRVLSALRTLRLEAAEAYPQPESTALDGVSVDDLESALFAAKILSYTQGYMMLADASRDRDYGIDLAEIARIWKAGCIIRAAFLDDVYDAFTQRPDLPMLLLAPFFQEQLKPRLAAWRRVVAAAVQAGIAVPALSSSLAWFDTAIRARGTANVIQAQRDWFGAHTYRRREDPDTPVHSDWDTLEQVQD